MFKELRLKSMYTSMDDNIAEDFYNPVLRHAVKYDRISAYFSAKALATYAKGLEIFARNGYCYRLIISKDISYEDYKEIKAGYKIKSTISTEMLNSLKDKLSLEDEKNFSNLAFLIANGVVEIKIAFMSNGIFHDKCGILYDNLGEIICFRGSNNETEAAIKNNYEAFQLVCSWMDANGFYKRSIDKSIDEFELLWNNKHSGIIVLDADDMVMNEILSHNKGELIVDEVFLKDNTIILDYNNQLMMRLNIDDIAAFMNKPVYKLHIKRYVDKLRNSILFLNQTLTYTDFLKIIKTLENKIPAIGIEFSVTERLKNYIEARNMYIEKRAMVGIEIKNMDEKLQARFEEFKAIIDVNMSRKLRDKQMWDAFFMSVMTKAGNFSVPGSGKTSSVFGMYTFLKQKKIVDKIVVICPKNAFGSWIDEFKLCFEGKENLKLFNIQNSKFKCIKDKRRALEYDSSGCNLLLFNYETIGSLKKEIKNIVSSQTLLVYDEVHKIKRINGEYASHALEIGKESFYTIAMTGTPIPNSYLDLFNMLNLLYSDEYKEFFGFDLNTLKQPSGEEIERINRKIQPFFCRTTKHQLLVPEANEDIIDSILVKPEEQKLFEIISAKYRNNKLALFIRLLQLESNPQMLLKAINISELENVFEIEDDVDDSDYVDYSEYFVKLIGEIDVTSKKQACVELICNLVNDNKKVVLWCIFKDSINDISKRLKEIGILTRAIYGEVELEERFSIIEDFKNGKFDVLITNPHTLAESVSLHAVCHDAVYFEYSYNLVHLLQSKDRIHRLGLPDGQYTQYYFMQDIFKVNNYDYSLDAQVYDRLKDKERIMGEAIENGVLETVSTNEDDLDIIFGKYFN